jgi:hypothetical protein
MQAYDFKKVKLWRAVRNPGTLPGVPEFIIPLDLKLALN